MNFVRFIAYIIVPLLGVIFFGWDARQILIVYWLENIIAGILAAIGILKSTMINDPQNGAAISLMGMPTDDLGAAKRHSAGMFVVLYGVFAIVYGAVVLFLVGRVSDVQWASVDTDTAMQLYAPAVLCAIVAAVVQISIALLLPPKYPSVAENFGRPFLRTFPLHIAIVLGGSFIAMSAVLLIAVHGAMDMLMMRSSHKNFRMSENDQSVLY